MVLVCNGQRQPNRNNRNNRNNNRGQLRSGRQQQPQRGRNNNRNNNRNNRNNQGGRKAKQSQCGGGNKPNHTYRGQNFLISWRLGCSKFTQSQGERFCRANNMRAVSLDSREKEDHFLGIVAKDRQRYFSTGPTQEAPNVPSLITEKGMSSASQFLMISTLTGSDFMTSPATTRNPSSVKPSAAQLARPGLNFHTKSGPRHRKRVD